MTTENANPRHLARPVQRLCTTTRRLAQKGLNAENSRPATARGGDISLDIPFYRTTGWTDLFGSPNDLNSHPLVNVTFTARRSFLHQENLAI
jgi:hypothetical protein